MNEKNKALDPYYSGLCLTFINKAMGEVLEDPQNASDETMEIRNEAYGLQAFGFLSKFRLAEAARAIVPVSSIRQDLYEWQSKLAKEFADVTAARLLKKFPAETVLALMPSGLKTRNALAYAEEENLPGLAAPIRAYLR